MDSTGKKLLALLAVLMTLVFAAGVLASVDAIDVPGEWREKLGLAETGSPDNPCRLGLYRETPENPPPPPGHWRPEAKLPRALVEGSAVAIGPVIYTFGGSAPGNLHRVMAYHTRSGRWSEPTRLPTGLNHAQAVAYRGDAYLAGGYLDGLEPTGNFWRYDPRANRWTELPPMGRARGAAAAAVIGDKLYVADGAPQTYGVSSPGGPYARLESYDFATGRWSVLPDAPVAVHHVDATALDGRFYMAGGRVDPEESSDEFLRYDPGAKRWERLPPLPYGKYSSVGMVSAAGKVVAIAGDDELGWQSGGGTVSASAWAFDPGSDRWQRLPDLAVERHAFGAAETGGRIYAIGGSYCPGIKPNGPVPTYTVESLPASAVAAARSPR
jgi:N-acetylneuraminic acid mutarotase